MGNLIGRLAWVVLALIGLFTVVDLGFGPIVICPRCGSELNLGIGIGLIVIAVAAFVTDLKAGGC